MPRRAKGLERKKTKFIGLTMSRTMYDAVALFSARDTHMSVQEWIREAIRDKLSQYAPNWEHEIYGKLIEEEWRKLERRRAGLEESEEQ